MPPFVPYPPDSLRSNSESKGGRSKLPFTQAFLATMRLGYSRRDLAVMPYGEVIYELAAASGDHLMNEGEEPSVVMATQEDIRSMLG